MVRWIVEEGVARWADGVHAPMYVAARAPRPPHPYATLRRRGPWPPGERVTAGEKHHGDTANDIPAWSADWVSRLSLTTWGTLLIRRVFVSRARETFGRRRRRRRRQLWSLSVSMKIFLTIRSNYKISTRAFYLVKRIYNFFPHLELDIYRFSFSRSVWNKNRFTLGDRSFRHKFPETVLFFLRNFFLVKRITISNFPVHPSPTRPVKFSNWRKNSKSVSHSRRLTVFISLKNNTFLQT